MFLTTPARWHDCCYQVKQGHGVWSGAEALHRHKKVPEQVHRLGGITRKLAGITKYKTKNYLESKIIDIENSSKKNI
jgi:hypothetical protein